MSFIKNTLLIFATLTAITLTPALAQKCKLDKDQKDAFTGEITRSYKHAFITKGPTFWEFALDRKGNSYSFGVSPRATGRTPVSAPKGTKIFIKLYDDTIIEEELQQDVAPTFSGNNYTYWKLTFHITEARMKQLAASPINDIKITVNGTEHSVADLGTKHGDKIQIAAGCIIANQ